MDSTAALFSSVFARALSGFTQISEFRQTAHTAVDAAGSRFHRIARQYAEMMFHPRNEDRYFADPEGALEVLGGIDGVTQQNVQRRISSFVSMIEAASLIYAHSLLEGIVIDLCRCIADTSPSTWDNRIARKQVPFERLSSASLDDIRQQLVDEYLKALDRDSLPKKIETLLGACRPPKDFSPLEDFSFDGDRIQFLDAQRHDLVHGALPLKSAVSADQIDFLQKTALYLVAMVSHAYGLRAEATLVAQEFAGPATA